MSEATCSRSRLSCLPFAVILILSILCRLVPDTRVLAQTAPAGKAMKPEMVEKNLGSKRRGESGECAVS